MKKILSLGLTLNLVLATTVWAKNLSTKSEELRQKLVAEELAKYDKKALSFDASALPENDQIFLQYMLKVANLIEELNMLQINENNLQFSAEVEKDGTENDKELFHRNQSPWCLEDNDFLCNALSSLPRRRMGENFWPQKMNEKILAEIGKGRDADKLLSPFTYVRTGKLRRFKAIPFSQFPLLKEQLKQLAEYLRESIPYADDLSLKRFLRTRAMAFESKSAYPYDTSDYDWISLKGKWEITIGPYETYKELMKQKAQFEMYLGLENKKITEQLEEYKRYLQDFENDLAEFIGSDLYRPRKLNRGIVVRAIDVVYASGDARSPHGAVVAYHLPNRGRTIEEGFYKKVFLLNHMQLFEELMQKRANVLLIPSQAVLINSKYDVMNTVFHEFMHGFGTYEEMEINDVFGNRTTVGKALGAEETLMEELKADVGSLWLIPSLVKRDLISTDDINKRYAASVIHLFGLLQYSLKGTYPQMAGIEIGNLIEHGALSYNKTSNQFTIHFDKFPNAVNTLMKRIVTIQLTGDRSGAVSLRDQYLEKMDNDNFKPKEILAAPLAGLQKLFKKDGLKGFVVDYKITIPNFQSGAKSSE